MSPISMAAQKGADDCVRLLAHLGARFIEHAAPDSSGGPFWRRFQDSTTRVRNPKVWEWIASKGGDKGTDKSLQKRIKLLKQAGLEDPRDENSWYSCSSHGSRGPGRAEPHPNFVLLLYSHHSIPRNSFVPPALQINPQ